VSPFTYDFDDTDNSLLVEVTPATGTYQPGLHDTGMGDTAKKIMIEIGDEATKAAFGNILRMARYSAQIVRKLREKDPDVPLDNVEVEFGLTFAGETSVVLTKGSAEANLTVKIVWKAQP
jgi:hypothetical protein